MVISGPGISSTSTILRASAKLKLLLQLQELTKLSEFLALFLPVQSYTLLVYSVVSHST